MGGNSVLPYLTWQFFAFVYILPQFLKELHLYLLELVQLHFALLSAALPTIFI